MSLSDRITKAFQAFMELHTVFHEGQMIDPVLYYPGINDLLSVLDEKPPGHIPLGFGQDGWPVHWNITDPYSRSLVIIGDQGSGKNNLLKLIAELVDHIDPHRQLPSAVTAESFQDWFNFPGIIKCIGIMPSDHCALMAIITDAVKSALNDTAGQKINIILIDNLNDLLRSNECDRQALYWMITRGPQYGLIPVVTLNTRDALSSPTWVDLFQRKIFSNIESVEAVWTLAGDPELRLDMLFAGAQFVWRQGFRWQRFWVPVLEDDRLFVDGG